MVRLQPRDFVAVLSLRASNGSLEPHVDQEKLLRLVDEQVAGNGGAPVDATVALVDGRPKVIPSKSGIRFDPDEVTAAFTAALTKPEGEREVTRGGAGGGGGIHHQGRAGAEDRGGGLDVHDVLPLRRLPQHQHRPRDGADRRHRAQAGRDVLAQRHRGGADRRERLREGLHHRGRHLQGGLRRRGVAVGDDDVQRRVLRRSRGRRAQAPLVLHRPLPRRPRGHGGVAVRST